jgi:hypothetical protein
MRYGRCITTGRSEVFMTGFKSELAIVVTKALHEDERTGEAPIEVVDDGGVITLTGTVDSEEARDAAGEIARSVEGVVSVTVDLDVREDGTRRWPLPPRPITS